MSNLIRTMKRKPGTRLNELYVAHKKSSKYEAQRMSKKTGKRRNTSKNTLTLSKLICRFTAGKTPNQKDIFLMKLLRGMFTNENTSRSNRKYKNR